MEPYRESEDFEYVWDVFQKVMKNDYSFSMEDFKKDLRSWAVWICRLGSSRCGYIGLQPTSNIVAAIHAYIDPGFKDKKCLLMKHALNAFNKALDYAFNKLKLKKVEAIDSGYYGKFIKKYCLDAGFSVEGVLKNRIQTKNGDLLPITVYGLTSNEYFFREGDQK
ncbi:MAG: hypothetical protein CMI54_08550 [Parcubacteria group bacterium]|jgi:hypothetical protein|nr:hypothetical protein [Parcubacteria group bacterium]|tara:strand:- start:104 stop:598 length:495 start_codon:yes stop_codon:yes gene_type:complete